MHLKSTKKLSFKATKVAKNLDNLGYYQLFFVTLYQSLY